MKSCKFALFSILALVAIALADPTVSIFVKDASEFQALQADLQQLQAGIGNDNPELNALIDRANRIAKMNDRCSMISLNEVLDDECGHFYAVELPEFEARYMEVTGELRLGVMTMANNLEQRTQQIDACTDAFSKIIASKENLLKIEGNVDLEPLSHNGAFDASYNFKLIYDERRMDQQKHFVELWMGKCGEIVLRKSGDEFAPLFVQAVSHMNDSLLHTKTNLKVVLDSSDVSFYLDLNRPVAGSYYLSGAQLFKVDQIPSGRDNAHLLVKMKDKSVVLPRGRDGEMQAYKGRVEFEKASDDLVGRWIWNRDSVIVQNTVSEPKMVNMTTEPDYEDYVPEPAQTAAPAESVKTQAPIGPIEDDYVDAEIPQEKEEKSSGPHWGWITLSTLVMGAGAAMYFIGNSKAKDSYDKTKDGLTSKDEYDSAHDDISKYQTIRAVGIGVAAAGALGLVLSIVF